MLASRLKAGDVIGLIAPDKALKNKDIKCLKKADKYFESLGLKVKHGKYLFSEDNYCAGTPKERADDLNEMFRDKDVKAVFTAKGGDKVDEILPYIDFELIKDNPKIFLGMSDITVLLCAINKVTGLITFHCQDYTWFGKEECADYDKSEIVSKLFNGNKYITAYDKRQFANFKSGEIKGKIYGTNARCLLKLTKTRYMPDLRGAILFLESFHSDVKQWHSMLKQYNEIGALDKAVVFGYIYQLQKVEKDRFNLVEELAKVASGIPTVKTNDFGHMHGNSIIPIGVDVVVNAKDRTIVVDSYLK